MLDQAVWDVYTKFKLHFYLQVMGRFQNREASLTTVETYCMEINHALGTPTVNEFATCLHISASNAAYKVASLVKKGYIEKLRSENDRREYHLKPTKKFQDYYNLGNGYVRTVMARVKQHFSPEDCKRLEEMLHVIGAELMPEVSCGKDQPEGDSHLIPVKPVK